MKLMLSNGGFGMCFNAVGLGRYAGRTAWRAWIEHA
jgi:hypothetical protein